MPDKNALLQLSRKIHLYYGLVISPALLFFAFTGGYQTLGLHEAASNYKPPALLAELAQIHKKQTDVLPARRPGVPEGARPNAPEGTRPEGGRSLPEPATRTPTTPSPTASAPVAASAPGRSSALPATGKAPQTLQAKQKQHLPLKIFVVLVSLGLFTNTLTGVYMAYKYDRNKVLVTALLLAGLAIPLLLLRF